MSADTEGPNFCFQNSAVGLRPYSSNVAYIGSLVEGLFVGQNWTNFAKFSAEGLVDSDWACFPASFPQIWQTDLAPSVW